MGLRAAFYASRAADNNQPGIALPTAYLALAWAAGILHSLRPVQGRRPSAL